MSDCKDTITVKEHERRLPRARAFVTKYTPFTCVCVVGSLLAYGITTVFVSVADRRHDKEVAAQVRIDDLKARVTLLEQQNECRNP